MELKEAVELRLELCWKHKGTPDCGDCPLRRGGHCAWGVAIGYRPTGEASSVDDVERILEAYKKDKKLVPIQRYPTWNEFLRDKFPEATGFLQPCAFEGGDNCKLFFDCYEHLNSPIPESVAVRLGITKVVQIGEDVYRTVERKAMEGEWIFIRECCYPVDAVGDVMRVTCSTPGLSHIWAKRAALMPCSIGRNTTSFSKRSARKGDKEIDD